jgi:small-conductance mechanosensitive channel
MKSHRLRLWIACIGWLLASSAMAAQDATPEPPAKTPPATAPADDTPAPAAQKVEVQPLAEDEQISGRLESILNATGWFTDPHVRVEHGVVFLTGTAQTEDHKTWATNLVQNTQDVVAVVNKMQTERAPVWNFQPAIQGLREMWLATVALLPFIALGILILLITVGVARLSRRATERVLRKRVTVPLLREVIARAAALLMLLLGLFIVLRVTGLTRVAMTVLGGTGLLGLVIGIAFRDITENFLASIFLSIQRPFQVGDLIEIVGVQGFVNRLTIRSTIVNTLDGNYVQIPNATVYKNTIRNFTNNPNRRDDFVISLGYQFPLATAQQAALQALKQHPAVLATPEASVLVDSLAPALVNLRVYYWIDGSEHNYLAVRSAVLRSILSEWAKAGIELKPGPSAIVFPQGVPVLVNQDGDAHVAPQEEAGRTPRRASHRDQRAAARAEQGLNHEAEQIKQQGREARLPDEGANLLQEGEPRSDGVAGTK